MAANFRDKRRERSTMESGETETPTLSGLTGSMESEKARRIATSNAIVRSDDGIYTHPATGVKLDNRGIIWAAGLTPESLFSFTTDLIAFQDKAQLWLGDTVSYLKNRFEISEEDIALQYHLSERQVLEYTTVCEAVPRDLRPDHPRISYSHIRLVSREKYKDKQRAQHLAHAAKQNMTVSQFEEYLRGLGKPSGDDTTLESDAARDAMYAAWHSFTSHIDYVVTKGYLSRKQREEFRRDAVAYINEKLRIDAD